MQILKGYKEINPYRPLFGDFDRNLKRRNLWNSVEVHVIYALVFTLCMSRDGVKELKKYFSAEDQDVFDPFFIAQYLLAPVNTIVKNSLLPWMMEKLQITTVKASDKDCARKTKAEVFLKYSLLVQLMHIVKKYGRNDDYNFENDDKLFYIKSGEHSDKQNPNNPKRTLAINSFMTIWLVTLPEKFQEWYGNRNSLFNVASDGSIEIFFTGFPIFPVYSAHNLYTALSCNQENKNYEFLPTTWNLMECFEYYYKQEGMWSTKSIEEDWNSANCLFPSSSESSDDNNKEENEEGKDDRNNEVQKEVPAIKTNSDDEENRLLQAGRPSK